jgi:single-strand DNA-binding protein
MRNDGAVLTMSGRAATNPTISGGKGERVSFRAVSTERRFDDASGDWIDGDEFGVTVVCWRQLGSAVLQLLRKGDPVVVVGKISTRKYEKDGAVDYFTEVKADHVAFDVARASGRIKREEADVTFVKRSDSQEGQPPENQPEAHLEAGDPLQLTGPSAGRPLVEVR